MRPKQSWHKVKKPTLTNGTDWERVKRPTLNMRVDAEVLDAGGADWLVLPEHLGVGDFAQSISVAGKWR